MKLLPRLVISAEVISKIEVVASVEPLTWIRLLVVVGLSVKTPVPSRVEDQSTLLPLKVIAPIPVKAAVIEMVPVPALAVRSLPAPAIALAMVISPLLALLLSVKSEFKVTGLELPRVITTSSALELVVIVPPKLKEEGDVGANEPPAYVKVSLAESPMVSVPLVSKGVAVKKLVMEFVEPVILML